MSGLYFDAWAAATPNGSSLGELTKAYAKSYRGVHQGMGFGQFTINRHDAQAAWAATGNLIRVRRVTGGPFAYDSANYIGEFWIEGGDDKLLSKDEEGGEDLTRGGRTGEACLEGAVLYPDAFDSRNDRFTTKTRIDGNWHIDDRTAGEVLAIFLRDLDDRTPDPLAFVSKDFGVLQDSNDVDWTDTDTKWQFPVGTNGLQLLETCVSGGLFYRVSPDFTFHAYETEPGDDLTATVVITKGVELVEGADRQVYARTTISRALVQGTKESGKLKYREVVNSTIESALPRRREGFVEFRRTPTNNKLDKAGNRYISKMKRRHDGATSARVVETTGQEAFTDYVPGDLVTLDIPGIYDSVSTRVYAIVLEEDEAGNVDPVIEFEQSPFDPATNRDGDFEEGKGGNGSNGGTNCGDCPPIPPYVPDLAAPEVQWLNLQSNSNPGYTLFTVDASDDGAAWSTIASGADLATGTGDPNGAGPVPGVVQVSALRHRYWRITFTQLDNTDFASGTGELSLGLLSNGTTAAVCRLGTLWVVGQPWYVRTLVSVTTDPNYVATCDWPHLYGNGLTNQSTITAQPSDGAWGARNAAESGDWTRLATWVFDIGVESDVFGGPLEGQEHVEETAGNGTATVYTTNYPYAPGSLEVYVNGVLWPVTETSPTAGTFTFASAPPLDAVIIIDYQNAGTTATGATNTIPVASTPPTVDSIALDDLTDVNAPTPADGEVLTWDDYLGQWEPAATSEPTADAHIADTTDAHDASAVSVLDTAANFTGTDVEAVLAELQDNIDAVGGILNNYAATTDPTVNEDSGDGYAIGSRWINTTTDEEFVCTDASVGAASWVSTTDQGAGSGDVATDTIWDAAGDLVVGTGANTAARLAAGSAGQVLTIAAGVPAWAAAGSGGAARHDSGVPTGTLLRSYTFDTTVESWTASAGTITASSGKARLAHTVNTVGLEPVGAADQADGELEGLFTIVSGTEASIVFRADDASNFYMMTVVNRAAATDAVWLYKCVAGTFTALIQCADPNLIGVATVVLMVRFIGSQLEGYLNGHHVFTVVDATFSTGRIGMRTYNGTVDLDTIRLYESPSRFGDNV